MSMQELLNIHTWLAQSAMLDTHQALAHLVAWLDPLQAEEDPDAFNEAYYEGDEDYLLHAITICRACFPDVYAELVQKLRRGCSEAEANDFICTSINRRIGTEIDDVEWMTWGIPVPFMGVDVEQDSFWEDFPRVAPVLACFGITPEDREQQRSGVVHTLASALIEHLEAQQTPPLADLAMLLRWLFSGTGNSLMDYTVEYWYDGGLEWLPWTPEEVAFAAEMIQEARDMMNAALRGLDLLADETFFAAFQHNIAQIQHEIERRKTGGKPTAVTIEWPDCSEHPAANTPAA